MATVNDTPVNSMDALDLLKEKLSKLHALMTMTFGASADTFNGLSDEHRDNYLWACSTLAAESRALAASLTPASVEVQA
jgi:hypothetical protein